MATTSHTGPAQVPGRRASRVAVVVSAVVLCVAVVGGSILLGAVIEAVTVMFSAD